MKYTFFVEYKNITLVNTYFAVGRLLVESQGEKERSSIDII